MTALRPSLDAPAPDVLTATFGRLEIEYDDRLLTPRAWTIAQSRWASDLLRRGPDGPVLELCCGAGHLGLAAIAQDPRPLVSVDVSPVACDYTRRNAERAGLAEHVDVRVGRMTEVLRAEERFALVIADPPWVRSGEVGRFPEDPVRAIDGGPDGLARVRECLDVAAAHLAPEAGLLLQVGPSQGRPVALEAARHGLDCREVSSFGHRGSIAHLVLA